MSEVEVVDACFDTNLIIDLSTLRGFESIAHKEHQADFDVIFAYRRERAKAALAAAWLCHRQSLRTFSMRGELERVIVSLAPPDTVFGLTPWFFAWFLKDWVLTRWIMASETESDAARGDSCDRRIVEMACELKSVLVSTEVKAKGMIAKHAASLSVQVQTPQQWVSSYGLSVQQLNTEMLNMIELTLPAFMCTRKNPRVLDNCRVYWEIMDWLLSPLPALS